MKILTFTTVYPNPTEPALGIFVRRRVQAMARLADVKVLAPIPVFNYQRGSFSLHREYPRRREDGSVEILAPRWFYPPAGGAGNAVCLYISTCWPISALRKQFPFDVIDAHFAHPDGVAAALLAGTLNCPFTVTLRGNEQDHVRYPLRRRCMAWALRRAGRVIAVANVLRDLALELGVNPARVVTIPNGIDTEIFHPRDRQAMRAKFEIPSSTRLIVSAGNLIELKGHHRTIQALQTLVDSGLDAMLLIASGAGSGSSYESTLRALVSQLKLDQRVRFLGQMLPESLAELICAADVFCLGSSREGWPNVVHESLACGIPVVATRVGGAPDMIPTQELGILVPPNDSAELANALRKALSAEWNRSEIAAWGATRSWDQVASEVIREMEAVVAERK